MSLLGFYKKNKTHILLAFLFAIIADLFGHIIVNALSRLFIFLSEIITTYFLDSLYKDVAWGRTDYSLLIFSTPCLICLGLLTGFLFPSLKKNINEGKLKDVNNSVGTDIFDSPSFIRFKRSMFTTAIIFTVLYLFDVVACNIKYTAIMNFEQNIKILTPYISSNEKDLIISKFASMQSYQDYKSINEQLEKVAKENNIALPRKIIATY